MTTRLSTPRLLPMVSLILLCIPPAAIAQDCSQITKYGIFDLHSSATQTDLIDDVIHWLSVNEYSTESDARNAAAGVGITIPVVDITLNADGTYGDSHSSTWSKATAAYLKTHSESHTRASQEFVTANPQIVAAWQSCVTQFSQSGLHTELVQVDACKSSFVAWYRPNGQQDTYPRIQSLSISGGTCDKPPTNKVPYGGFNVTCRKHSSESLIVSLNTDKGNGEPHLEALPGEPEPPKQVKGTKVVTSPQPKVCNVNRGVPGNSMSYSGTCVAPGPILSATYTCEGPGCGWCYGFRNASRGPDWDISGAVLTWYRLCQGWAPALMTYTLTYTTVEEALIDNPNYDSEHKRWEARRAVTNCSASAGTHYTF